MTVPGRHGLLLLDKKPGLTSFDALNPVKKAFATGKAGHTGTLDKFASGLLLVLVGRAVKLTPLFSHCDKEYRAAVLFGEETDTLDPEGTVIARGPLPSREDVEAALAAFRGDIEQAPPAYSAVHINGRRAYELAREGKAPEMKKRPVTVHDLEILSWTPPEAILRVRCSSGTYIRSLARDIALAAGTRARLASLIRTRVGAFNLADAVDPSTLESALRPLDRRLFAALSLPVFLADEAAAAAFTHGKPLRELNLECSPEPSAGDTPFTSYAGVFRKEEGSFLGVIETRNGNWSYAHVFADC